MAKNNEPATDALVKETEELLSRVNDVGLLAGDLPDETIADINSQIHLHELESANVSAGPKVDGRLEIHLSADNMLATARFFPPMSGGASLEMSSVKKLFAERSLVYGVKWDAVTDAVQRCNTEEVEIGDVVIAEGKKPVPASPEHFVPIHGLLEAQSPRVREGGRVEHKERSPFVMVEKGALLARKISAKKGERGWNVYGNEIPPPQVRTPVFRPGANTVESLDGVLASRAGRFLVDRQTFFVTPVLQIPGDVDYSTGHLDFDGDIVIGGDVKPGFDVKASGSIYCAKTLSASHVVCRGDLIINRGIIGRQKSEVRVGGSIRCKYIEHCFVEARGPITAFVGIMNSVVNTNDRIVTGPRGILVGGKLSAQNGVETTRIGTSMGPATEVYCGVDHTILRRLEWARDRNIELATKLNRIWADIRSNGDSSGRLTTLAGRLQMAVRRLNSASVALLGHLDKNERATVQVRDTVHANTYIEICHISFVVASPMGSGIFALDRKHGKIVFERHNQQFAPTGAGRTRRSY